MSSVPCLQNECADYAFTLVRGLTIYTVYRARNDENLSLPTVPCAFSGLRSVKRASASDLVVRFILNLVRSTLGTLVRFRLV